MPIQVSRLRRWFAIGAMLVALMVAGAYFYARHRVMNGLNAVQSKIGVDVQQTAQGFTISRSAGGRTIFKVQASRAIQFKAGGRTELHDVTITLYGQDSSRFDQIYGQSFQYDPQTGDVTGKGEVQIDLEANPEGALRGDQTPPKELKNPVHLRTSDLVFNQKTGNAHTDAEVDFQIPQAQGRAVGVAYTAKNHVLELLKNIQVQFTGQSPATVAASHGEITKDPRAVVLDNARVSTPAQDGEADVATLYLHPNNTLDHVTARGNVRIASKGKQQANVRAEKLDVQMSSDPDIIETAVLSGSVHMTEEGGNPVDADADRVLLDFGKRNLVDKLHLEGAVKLVQRQTSKSPGRGQDVQLTAHAVNLLVKGGKHPKTAETAGANPQIAIQSTGADRAGSASLTTIAAGKFSAGFNDRGALVSIHGAPDARIVNSSPGQPDRVSTSDTLDARFRPGNGMESIVQQGHVIYSDGDRKAWGEQARYTVDDQVLTMSGSPRVTEGGMTTTADSMRMNRATGDAIATGNVKSTYNDLKPQPNGALLASSAPIHVTARSMTAHRSPSVAVYSGDARLWQDANIVQAPTIHFDRDNRSLLAQAAAGQKVSTVVVQVDANGKATPITITSTDLKYKDAERRLQFEGGVTAKGEDATMTAARMDVYLEASGQTSPGASVQTGRLQKIVASGGVAVVQEGRRAEGEQLTYTAKEDKFVMTGNSPSIFDAEHGKITGVSLTFYRHDDRVLVEGNDSNPTITRTRVAR